MIDNGFLHPEQMLLLVLLDHNQSEMTNRVVLNLEQEISGHINPETHKVHMWLQT